MNVRFLAPANFEIDESVKYYNHQFPGLGYRLIQEISVAVDRIKTMPEAWTRIGEKTRRYILKSFPYALFYVIDSDEILITALVHLHRNPERYTDIII